MPGALVGLGRCASPQQCPCPGVFWQDKLSFGAPVHHLDGVLWSNGVVGRSKDILLQEEKKKAFVGKVTL